MTSRLLLLLRCEPLRPPGLNITLGQPPAGLNELDHVDDLLQRHDRETDTGDDPWPEAVHLVGSCELEGASTVRVGEDVAQERRVHLGTLLDRRRRMIGDRLQKVRGEERAAERQQIEGNEK